MTQSQPRVRPSIRARARELRQPLTQAESQLWSRLRNRGLGGFKFRRQHPVGRFIVDFCCAARRLVTEIDDASHAERLQYDQARTDWLNERGYQVMRFTNQDIYRRLDAVLEEILRECQGRD